MAVMLSQSSSDKLTHSGGPFENSTENPADVADGPSALQRKYRESLPAEFELTGEFEAALDAVENGPQCVFVTGKAGTGKSTLLRYWLATTARKVAVLAPTGLTALNVHGQTIHSCFRFPPRIIAKKEIARASTREISLHVDTLVIDEISMVRADLLDGIDQVLRRERGAFSEPFGGLRVVLFGDLFQLSPIVSRQDMAAFRQLRYASPFFFDSHVFNGGLVWKTIELQRIFRQKDEAFIALLNRIRYNQVDDRDLTILNQRCRPGFEAPDGTNWVTLSTTNRTANRINQRKLAQLPGPPALFRGKIEGDFREDKFPADRELMLKVGAQVMFVKNDAGGRWVNGTLGKVVKIKGKRIKVQIGAETRPVDVGQETWEAYAYTVNREERSLEAKVVGTFTQYPLKLAWAMTIHKGQGRTFEKTVIDLGNGAFTHGQSYVALSRCTTLEGIVLRQRMRRRDIMVDGEVLAFMSEASTV